MTNPTSLRIGHYNNLTWGACHYYVSANTGKRLVFRANEIESVRPSRFGNAVVRTVEGCAFDVTSRWPGTIS